jgi:asparagine synthase (glutamine-hydrolysing)
LYFVSKLAHDSGVTVVQVGAGSDEQVCGYDGYMRYLNLYHNFWSPYRSYLPQPMQAAAAYAASWASKMHPKLPVYADILDRTARDRGHFWICRCRFGMPAGPAVALQALGPTDHHARMVEAA